VSSAISYRKFVTSPRVRAINPQPVSRRCHNNAGGQQVGLQTFLAEGPTQDLATGADSLFQGQNIFEDNAFGCTKRVFRRFAQAPAQVLELLPGQGFDFLCVLFGLGLDPLGQ
jgi:hypothetical protein